MNNSTKNKNKKINTQPIIKAVDLFCGVGGLTNGLEQAGIDVVAGFDIDESVEHAYSTNNNSKFILRDITKLSSNEITSLLSGPEGVKTLVAGCAPCQPFSSYQKSKSMESRKTHYKYPAFEHFIRIVKEVRPDFVTMENVRGVVKDENFELFVSDLESFGYYVEFKVVNIANYGAPQNRKRLLLTASKDRAVTLPKFFGTPTVLKDAIGHLPQIEAGGKMTNDPLHTSSKLSPMNIERIRASRPGGTWRDWPERLLLDCYKRETGKTFSSVYGRLSPDKPSNTLTTQFTRYGTGRYGHYEQDRALSLREGSIIQTFPNDYDFNVEKLGSTKVAMHIGNAVPPIAGKVIGRAMIECAMEVWSVRK